LQLCVIVFLSFSEIVTSADTDHEGLEARGSARQPMSESRQDCPPSAISICSTLDRPTQCNSVIRFSPSYVAPQSNLFARAAITGRITLMSSWQSNGSPPSACPWIEIRSRAIHHSYPLRASWPDKNPIAHYNIGRGVTEFLRHPSTWKIHPIRHKNVPLESENAGGEEKRKPFLFLFRFYATAPGDLLREFSGFFRLC
jgi:hypothetical protein